MKPFQTTWKCDPCAPYRQRYIVSHPAGDRRHAWHEVIVQTDDARTRFLKWQTAVNVSRLAELSIAAEHAYRQYANGIASDAYAEPYLRLADTVHRFVNSH
jgi:hypothetical protein